MRKFEDWVIQVILIERLCLALLIDALLPVILPIIEPDRYKQIRWQYFLTESWTIFQDRGNLPDIIRQRLLFAGYLQLAFGGIWVLSNILEGLV